MQRLMNNSRKRRAAVLLMVVSLLALLFVIVTGFVQIAQNSREQAVLVKESDERDKLLDYVEETGKDLVMQIGKDETGERFSGRAGAQQETIPGFGPGGAVSPAEPVWNEGWETAKALVWNFSLSNNIARDSWAYLDRLQFPSVTTLTSTLGTLPGTVMPVTDPAALPTRYPIARFMFDDDDDDQGLRDNDLYRLDRGDIRRYARRPYLDADGDGVPDSALSAMAPLTTAVNASSGSPVSVPTTQSGFYGFAGIDQAAADGTAERLNTDRFRQLISGEKYDAAMRIVSHGGMIALDVARPLEQGTGGNTEPFNYEFTLDMLDAIQSQWDNTPFSTILDNFKNRDRVELFRSFQIERGDIEAELRNRGGLPSAPYATNTRGQAEYLLPGSLELLYELLPNTFRPQFYAEQAALRTSLRNASQRFNLGQEEYNTDNDRKAYARAAALRPLWANTSALHAEDAYNRRQLITTTNNSDELARKFDTDEPTMPISGPLAKENLRLFRGEQKFYLGEVSKAFDEVRPGIYRFNPIRGRVIIERLARYFGEMLSPYDGWDGLDPDPNDVDALTNTDVSEVISLKEQALSLAVNLVQAAAPRNSWDTDAVSALPPASPISLASDNSAYVQEQVEYALNSVPTVFYLDAASTVLNPDGTLFDPAEQYTAYVGQAPQPYFSEVTAHLVKLLTDDRDPNRWDSPDQYDEDEATEDEFGEFEQAAREDNVLTIAIELYNPFDPLLDNGENEQLVNRLSLNQYAIGIFERGANADADAVQIWPLAEMGTANSEQDRLIPGRGFRTIVLRNPRQEVGGKRNRYYANYWGTRYLESILSFNTVPYLNTTISDMWKPTTGEFPDALELQLMKWVPIDGLSATDQVLRYQSDDLRRNNWVAVDSIRIALPQPGSANQNLGSPSYSPGRLDTYTTAYRDLSPTPYYAPYDRSTHLIGEDNINDTLDDIMLARWGVATGVTKRQQDSTGNQPQMNTDLPANYFATMPASAVNPNALPTIGGGAYIYTPGAVVTPFQPKNWADPLPTTERFAPIAPLMTMNAGPVDLDLVAGVNPDPLYVRLNSLPMFGNTNDLRPRSFPTVGYMLYTPRYAHVQRQQIVGPPIPTSFKSMPASLTMFRAWQAVVDNNNLSTLETHGKLFDYPCDFGHMPIFDNRQDLTDAPGAGSTDSDPAEYMRTFGTIPWGQLVFDYFTTLDPTRTDVDPLEVPGRININTASWYVLSKLPMIGPLTNTTDPLKQHMPIRWDGRVGKPSDRQLSNSVQDLGVSPSSSFWDARLGVAAGQFGGAAVELPVPPAGSPLLYRHIGRDDEYLTGSYGHRRESSVPYVRESSTDEDLGRYRLGNWLAQAACAYRDGVQYTVCAPGGPPGIVEQLAYADAQLRTPDRNSGYYAQHTYAGGDAAFAAGISSQTYRRKTIMGESIYGDVRGTPGTATDWRPSQFGFLSIGELANVKGFDSARHDQLVPFVGAQVTNFTVGAANALGEGAIAGAVTIAPLNMGDFMKSVGVLANLDSQYLTTRSNTYTVYATLMDRDDPSKSMRTQQTIDLTPTLPRVQYYDLPLATDIALNSDRPPLHRAIQDFSFDGTLDNEPRRFDDPLAEPDVIASRRSNYFNVRYDN